MNRDIRYWTGLLSVCVIVLFCFTAAHAASQPDTAEEGEKMGYRHAPLMDDTGTQIPSARYPSTGPGDSQRIERSFENAPPLIPHDIADMPIKRGENLCISCHMPDAAAGMEATPIPVSHLTDLRKRKDLGGKLYPGRFYCTQCHVPQAELKPIIPNNFQREFRNKESSYNSNLMENLNEGVR